jgi:transcriptional regulator with XRE-family HTH domain
LQPVNSSKYGYCTENKPAEPKLLQQDVYLRQQKPQHMNIAMRTKIKTLREGKGLSQRQMAEQLHMDERNYKRIENGEKKTMDTELLFRIAELLEVDATELLVNETTNIENNDIHDNETSIVGGDQHIHNAFPDELKEAYKDMMQLMRELIDEKNKTIALMEQLHKK